MGFGILEPSNSSDHVPGTAKLVDSSGVNDLEAPCKDRNDVILVPQPSTSPNDPLNWPRWKKDLELATLSLCTAFGGIQGTLLGVATGNLAKEFHVDIFQAETLQSYQFLSCGIAAAISCIVARIFGKRPVYLLSVGIEFFSAIWNATGTSFTSVFWSRIFYGIGIGAFEAMVLSTIGDMYFVHQRGRRVAVWSAMGLGCTQLSPILGGYVTDTYGWRTQLWIISAFWGIAMLMILFGCPETAYKRPVPLETDISPEESLKTEDMSISIPSGSGTSVSEGESGIADDLKSPSVRENIQEKVVRNGGERKRSYLAELLPVRGIESRSNPLVLLLRYCLVALYPAMWCAFLIIGTYVAWFVATTVTLAQIFQTPPLDFTATKMGYLNTFCAPAALIAFLLTHSASDLSVKILARRNKTNPGVYEPEFRLLLLIPTLAIGFPGFALFGWYTGTYSVSHEGDISWAVTSFLYAMIVYTTITAQVVAFAYLLDAHRDISVETSVFVVMLRNFFNFGAATFVPRWLETSGVSGYFYWICGLQSIFVLLPGVSAWIFGKKIRAALARWDLMGKFGAKVEHACE